MVDKIYIDQDSSRTYLLEVIYAVHCVCANGISLLFSRVYIQREGDPLPYNLIT